MNLIITAMKYLFSVVTLGGAIILLLLKFDEKPVFIQSLESKTLGDRPVFNKISYQKLGKKDIWMMNQSHHGPQADKDKWDRLAIIVDQDKNPKEATFLQLPPGELIWNDNLMEQKIDFKVSCFMCHSNGPRVIRPNDSDFKIPLQSKIKMFIWNLRIKSYGFIKESSKQLSLDEKLIVPFRHRLDADNIELNIKSCTKCHNGENTLLDRNKLNMQNNISIKFMIENKIMPPLGFSISDSDVKELNKFIRGI